MWIFIDHRTTMVAFGGGFCLVRVRGRRQQQHNERECSEELGEVWTAGTHM